MVSKDKYYFERIGKENHQKEFFNFDTMTYCKKKPEGVSLSTIDAMTTLFTDGKDLDDYIENEIDEYTYRISYIYKKEEHHLIPVWDDMKLNAISKTHNFDVDFGATIPKNILLEIFDELVTSSSGFRSKMLKREDESHHLDYNSEKTVNLIAANRNRRLIEEFVKVFSNYHEFRKLYLNYRDYYENNYKLAEELQKVFQKKKKKR